MNAHIHTSCNIGSIPLTEDRYASVLFTEWQFELVSSWSWKKREETQVNSDNEKGICGLIEYFLLHTSL